MKLLRRFDSAVEIGRLHVQNEIVCQDRVLAIHEDGLTILAVSDGMGSCVQSEYGAEFAINFIRNNAQLIYQIFNSSLENSAGACIYREGGELMIQTKLPELIFRMQKEGHDRAEELYCYIEDMHCTLSFVIIGPELTIALAIGDCPIYAKTTKGFYHLNGNGDIDPSSNVAVSIFSFHGDYMDIKVEPTENLQAVLIMSDGCLGFDKEESHIINNDDFPGWFHLVMDNKLSTDDAIKGLIENGYDDCAFCYCIMQ